MRCARDDEMDLLPPLTLKDLDDDHLPADADAKCESTRLGRCDVDLCGHRLLATVYHDDWALRAACRDRHLPLRARRLHARFAALYVHRSLDKHPP